MIYRDFTQDENSSASFEHKKVDFDKKIREVKI